MICTPRRAVAKFSTALCGVQSRNEKKKKIIINYIMEKCKNIYEVKRGPTIMTQ